MRKSNYFRLKQWIWTTYDILSVLVILLSFDKMIKTKSIKTLKPWQVARLIERGSKLTRTFRSSKFFRS